MQGQTLDLNNFANLVQLFFLFIVVPIIFLGLLRLSWRISRQGPDTNDQFSRRAAFWLGMIAFLFYIVVNVFSSNLRFQQFSIVNGHYLVISIGEFNPNTIWVNGIIGV